MNQDFLFIFFYPKAYAHLINTNIKFVHLKNDLNHSIYISLKNSLKKITKMEKEYYYLVNEDSHGLTTLKLLLKCQ